MSEEIVTIEELLALLKKRPQVEGVPTPDEAFRNVVANIEWFDVFAPKLEAFLEDHVSRAQLKKLTEEFQERVDVVKADFVRVKVQIRRLENQENKRLELQSYEELRIAHEAFIQAYNEVLERLEKMLK